jgi:hypothetical protein
MPFTFERFVALTAALAAAGSALHGCGSNAGSNSPATTEGRPNDAGSGGDGPLPGGGGAFSGGRVGDAGAGGSSDGVGGRETVTGGSWSGEGGEGGAGGESGAHDPGGSAAGTAGASTNAGADAGVNGGEAGASGGEGGAGSPDGTGGRVRRPGTGGYPASGGQAGAGEAGSGGVAGSGGEAGAANEVCYGEVGSPECWTLPYDECPKATWGSTMSDACYQNEIMLHDGAAAALIECFQEISVVDRCGAEMRPAIDECTRELASRACPTSAATEACTTGLVVDGEGTLPSPVANCTDGTLTTELCISALSVVSSYTLPDVARCADPTGEYSSIVSGTCAERIEECVFPHEPLYPWQ